jgi:hypothetical protein
MANRVDQLAKILPSAWDANSSVHYSKLTDAVNSLLGYNGPAVIGNVLDVQGNPVQNVAAPTASTDALNLGTAESKYSPAVTGPQFDVGGSNALKGVTYLFRQKYVNGIVAGAGIAISPTTGIGVVTISAISGGGGIDQLTGDVTAGPGVGSQAAAVVKVNGGVVPASAAYVGTNSSRQIVAAPTPYPIAISINGQTTNYLVLVGDLGKIIRMNAAGATTVTLPVTFATGFWVWVKNVGAGTCTVSASSGNIDAHASIPITQYQAYQFYWDGSLWRQLSQSLSA